MKGPIKKVRGAILVMAALILTLLIGVAAFALDLGRLFVLHTEMQNAVDAAVLSAAAELGNEDGSFQDVKNAANQDMLNHLAHFSKQVNLLDGLEGEAHTIDEDDILVFTFYSWIGGEYDSSVSPCGAVAPDKCITTDYADASYVQIKLDPALLGTDDDRYEIDLYFLPVLSVFGIETATEASTQVEALAGSHDSVCDYPPVYICGDEFLNSSGEVTLTPGDMVIFHGSGNPQVPGGFGWLMPGYSSEDPWDDGLGPNSNELFHRRLGAKYPLDCGPQTIEINNGGMSNSSGDAINARFGLFPTDWHFNYPENIDSFPSAPNVIDYPRDSELMMVVLNPSPDPDGDDIACVKRLGVDEGNGDWGDVGSQCVSPNKIQPSTFTRTDYATNFNSPGLPSDALRYDYYKQEVLSGLSSDLPASTIDNAEISAEECQCNITGTSKKTGWRTEACTNNVCRMLYGEPGTAPNPYLPVSYVGTDDTDKRRELFISMIDCDAVDFGAPNPVIDLAATNTKWARFFLTEHVGNPSAPEIYTEFIEEVEKDKDDQHFKKVIQLYE